MLDKEDRQRCNIIFGIAHRFDHEMGNYVLGDGPLDSATKADVCAVMLTDLLKHTYWATGAEAVDHVLSEFVTMFTALTENLATAAAAGSVILAQVFKQKPPAAAYMAHVQPARKLPQAPRRQRPLFDLFQGAVV